MADQSLIHRIFSILEDAKSALRDKELADKYTGDSESDTLVVQALKSGGTHEMSTLNYTLEFLNSMLGEQAGVFESNTEGNIILRKFSDVPAPIDRINNSRLKVLGALTHFAQGWEDGTKVVAVAPTDLAQHSLFLALKHMATSSESFACTTLPAPAHGQAAALRDEHYQLTVSSVDKFLNEIGVDIKNEQLDTQLYDCFNLPKPERASAHSHRFFFCGQPASVPSALVMPASAPPGSPPKASSIAPSGLLSA